MSSHRLLIAVMALAGCTSSFGQTAALSEAELAQLLADCNGVASSTRRGAVSACETLEKASRLSLVEPAAVAAYRAYRQQRREACERRLASPRGASRGLSSCGP